jgi:hypothetical protein
MSKAEKEYTLVEIRNAQEEISMELEKNGMTGEDVSRLEKASLSLRNMERALTQAAEKDLVSRMKQENKALVQLTKSMAKESEHLFRITAILQKIIQKTGRIIDILDLVR